MKTLFDLAKLVNGEAVGDDKMIISGVSEIQNGRESTITFLGNSKYKKYLSSTKASAVIVDEPSLLNDKSGIIHKNPQLAIAKILEEFSQNNNINIGISKKAYVSPSATIGKNISIGHFSVIEDEAVIGDNTVIGSNTTISNNTSIGNNCSISSNIHIYNNCKIGNNCIIHSGTVIGSDGFGFVTENGTHHKIPQNGNVIIGDNVEIGSNCALAAKTGVTKSLTGGKVYAGMPAREIREQHKRDAVYSEVLKIRKQLEHLEK